MANYGQDRQAGRGSEAYQLDPYDEQCHRNDGHDVHKKKGVAGKVKETLSIMRDTVTGHHKKHDDQAGHDEHGQMYGVGHEHEAQKVGCMDKMKDLIKGQKPREKKNGMRCYAHSAHWSANTARPHCSTEGAIHGGHMVGGRFSGHLLSNSKTRPYGYEEGHNLGGSGYSQGHKAKKEGVMSKVMDKLHLGSAHHAPERRKHEPQAYH
eukprot:Gb_34999 [translate_table: standard]